MKQTPLFNEHKNLGAKFCPFAGYEMPIQYKNLKDEVLSVRNNCGIFDVSHMGEFLFDGPDAVNLVSELITNSFIDSPVGKAVYSPLCNHEGKILDDLIVYKLSATKVLMCVNASNLEKDWDWVLSNKKDFNCEVANQSEETGLVALQGPNSFEILKSVISDVKDNVYYSVQECSFEGNKIIIARTGYTGEDGFEIFCHNDSLVSLWNSLINKDVTPCGLGARDVLRLEVAYPLYGNELSEEVTPLDTALKWTVDSKKGSFIGKDSLCDYKPQYKMRKFILDKGIPRKDYLIYEEDKAVGKVTSGTMSVMLGKGIALGLVDYNSDTKNGSFSIEIRGKRYPVNVSTKAFYKGGHK